MTARDEDRFDDFRPEDFDAVGHDVSADFVARTWRLVIADQEAIAREAARVDEIVLPGTLLDAYRAPEPAPDFVRRTTALVVEKRRPDDAELARLLAAYEPPQADPDFVTRTLEALRFDGAPAGGPRPLPARRSWPTRSSWPLRTALVGLAAAAAVVVALAWFGGERDASRPAVPVDVVAQLDTAQDLSPAITVTRFARHAAGRTPGLRYEPVDGLLLLATEADR